MINYIEKGVGLHKKLSTLGYSIWHSDGICYSNNDVEVQKIIDEYDPILDLKLEKKKEILKDSSDFLNAAILDKYPRFEVDTWQNQLRDAIAFKADSDAVTITLDAICSRRFLEGANLLNREFTADKIIEKASGFAQFSATYAGERQRLEDLTDSASTEEEVDTIKFRPL